MVENQLQVMHGANIKVTSGVGLVFMLLVVHRTMLKVTSGAGLI